MAVSILFSILLPEVLLELDLEHGPTQRIHNLLAFTALCTMNLL